MALPAPSPKSTAALSASITTRAGGKLLRLSAGTPPHDVFGRVREDARWWAAVASPVELVEYMAAAMRAILGGRTALCLDQRKRLMVETWHSLPDAEKQAFLDRVAPHAEEGRRRG